MLGRERRTETLSYSKEGVSKMIIANSSTSGCESFFMPLLQRQLYSLLYVQESTTPICK